MKKKKNEEEEEGGGGGRGTVFFSTCLNFSISLSILLYSSLSKEGLVSRISEGI
jgi:hypothetical protein